MIRGRTREAPMVHKRNVPTYEPPTLEASIHNRFDIEVIDATTGELKQEAFAENIILDRLWSPYMGNYQWFSYIHYGTGTGTPTASRSSLFTFLGSGRVANSNDAQTFNASTGVYTLRRKIQLSESTAVGSTITEVGIGQDSAAGSLCTHAMLKDMNGNQISILKTGTDIINIYATVFVHFNPTGYANGSITVGSGKTPGYDGNYYDLMYVLAGGNSYPDNSSTYAMAKFERGKGSGFDINPSTTSLVNFSTIGANKQVKGTMTRLGTNTGNNGGFGQINCMGISFRVATGGWFTGVPIVGEAIGTGDGVKTGFDFDFPYAGSVKVYVDGVEQTSGVTTRSLPNSVSFGSELNAIDASGNKIMAPKATGNLYGNSMWGGAITLYYENVNYATVGIKKYYVNYSGNKIYASTDLTTWVEISGGLSGEITVPEAYQKYRYWKSVLASVNFNCAGFQPSETTRPYGITFDTPPANGAVITADYTPECIAKDINHVFDFDFIIQLGEKTT